MTEPFPLSQGRCGDARSPAALGQARSEESPDDEPSVGAGPPLTRAPPRGGPAAFGVAGSDSHTSRASAPRGARQGQSQAGASLGAQRGLTPGRTIKRPGGVRVVGDAARPGLGQCGRRDPEPHEVPSATHLSQVSDESTSSSSAAMAAVTARKPERAFQPADRPTGTPGAASTLKATAARACVALPLARRGSEAARERVPDYLHPH